jgi:hypothetical protein
MYCRFLKIALSKADPETADAAGDGPGRFFSFL